MLSTNQYDFQASEESLEMFWCCNEQFMWKYFFYRYVFFPWSPSHILLNKIVITDTGSFKTLKWIAFSQFFLVPKREVATASCQRCVRRLPCSVGLAQRSKSSGWEQPVASLREHLGGRFSPCFTQRYLFVTWGTIQVRRFGIENFGELTLI